MQHILLSYVARGLTQGQWIDALVEDVMYFERDKCHYKRICFWSRRMSKSSQLVAEDKRVGLGSQCDSPRLDVWPYLLNEEWLLQTHEWKGVWAGRECTVSYNIKELYWHQLNCKARQLGSFWSCYEYESAMNYNLLMKERLLQMHVTKGVWANQELQYKKCGIDSR